MTRQFPTELFIGQVVHLYIEATGYAFESEVLHLNYADGRVHLQPIGYDQQFSAHPRAITSLDGLYLHFEANEFFFAQQPGA